MCLTRCWRNILVFHCIKLNRVKWNKKDVECFINGKYFQFILFFWIFYYLKECVLKINKFVEKMQYKRMKYSTVWKPPCFQISNKKIGIDPTQTFFLLKTQKKRERIRFIEKLPLKKKERWPKTRECYQFAVYSVYAVEPVLVLFATALNYW